MTTLLPEEIIRITDSLEVKWYVGRQIVVYRVNSLNQEILEIWQGIITETAKQWHPNQPYLALHDLSEPGVGTALSLISLKHDHSWRADFMDLVTPYVKAPMRIAILYAPTMSGNLAKISAEIETYEHNVQTFYDQDNALAWLH